MILAQPEPGRLGLETRAGRTYATTPASYPLSLPGRTPRGNEGREKTVGLSGATAAHRVRRRYRPEGWRS